MPRRRQPKALAAIQEDEELEVEGQQESSAPVSEQAAQLLEELDQQGAFHSSKATPSRAALSTGALNSGA